MVRPASPPEGSRRANCSPRRRTVRSRTRRAGGASIHKLAPPVRSAGQKTPPPPPRRVPRSQGPPRIPTLVPVPAPIKSAFAILAAATLCAAAGPTSVPRTTSAGNPTGTRSPRGTDDLAVLTDATADAATRSAAARRLLATDDPSTRAAVAAILTSGESGDARTALIREIRGIPSAPAWLLPPLAETALSATGADRVAVIDAVGSIRTRDAVRLLLAHTEPAQPQPVRDAAFAALARLTGRDLGPDAAAWRAWFEPVQWLPEAEWLRVLTEGLAQGMDRVTASRDRWLSRAVEAHRRLYVEETRAPERSAMLAALLRDETASLRRLGVELATREIANAKLLDTPVQQALVDLLRAAQPDLRRAAADLVYAAVPPETAEAALSEALLTETDPTVAAALLRAMAARPSPRVRPVVLGWLARPGPAQRPAIDAAAAMLNSGMLVDPTSQEAVLEALRSTDLSELPGSGLRLLALLGTEADRAAIASLLASPTPARRLQAAEALAAYGAFLPRILEAAKSDAGLFLTTSRAAAAASPTPEMFLTVSALPAPNEEARREGLLLIASRIDPRDLAAAAQRIEDLRLRELLLMPLLDVPLPAAPPGAAPAPPEPSIVAGLLLLARTRLELRQPAAALAALEPLSTMGASIDPQIDAVRCVALLWLNRVDEALELSAPASAWVEGLERCARLPHALDILDAIDLAFPGGPPEPERSKLQDLRALVAAEVMGPPEPGQN